MTTLEELLAGDEQFRYMMLGRMQSDCLYFIGHNGAPRLWGITVDDHITYMKALWKSFPKNGKPQWLKYGEILKYEKAMKEIELSRKN